MVHVIGGSVLNIQPFKKKLDVRYARKGTLRVILKLIIYFKNRQF